VIQWFADRRSRKPPASSPAAAPAGD